MKSLIIVVGVSACALGALAGTARADILVSAARDGDGSVFNYDARGNQLGFFQAYGAEFRGGVRVATGDVNGDGLADIITGAGPGGGPHVKVFSGRDHAPLHSFFAYDTDFHGGVFVAAGDLNGDGRADVIVGPGDGAGSPAQTGPRIRVINPVNEQPLGDFFTGPPGFTGGNSVAFGNMGPGGAPRVVIGTGPGGPAFIGEFAADGSLGGSALAYPPAFTGGVRVATGDLNGDGVADIITGPGAGANGNIRVFDGTNGQMIRSFFAFDPNYFGGVSVAAGDVSGDGVADIIVGELPAVQRTAGSLVKVFSGADLSEIASFQTGIAGGVELAFLPVPAPSVIAFGAAGLAPLLTRRRR